VIRVILFGTWLGGIAANALAQGQIVFDNFGSSSTSPTATSSGLFWLSTGGVPVLINQDFNAALYGGTNPTSLPLLITVLLSNGTGIGDNPSPGYFREQSGDVYTIQGAIHTTFVQVQAWTGNYNSYDAAVAAGAPAAQSPVFVNLVGVPPGGPVDVAAMPAMVLGVPEPSTFALVGLGCLLLRRRRRKNAV
jgi:hypothetical protein